MEILAHYSPRKLLVRWTTFLVILVPLWMRQKWPMPHELTIAYITDNILLLIVLLVVLGTAVIYLAMSFAWKPPVLMNIQGISDARLKIGNLPWDQIRSAKIYNAWGTTLLFLSLREPEKYANQLPLLHRLMLKWHRLDHSVDVYIDLSNLRVNPSDVLALVKNHLLKPHSDTA
jgi:hypothetical protein